MVMGVSEPGEAYEVKLDIKLGRGGEPEDFVQNIADVLKSRLRKSGRFPDSVITSYRRDSLLVVMGVPKEDLERNLLDLSQKGIIHGYTFAYGISATAITRAQAEENEIASLEALLEEKDGKLELAGKRLREAAADYEGLLGKNKLLEQKIRDLVRSTGTSLRFEEQKQVFVPVFQVQHEALAEITGAQSQYIRVQDINFGVAFGNNTPEQALKLMVLDQGEFFSSQLGTKINNKEDVMAWVMRQNHSLCKATCAHLKKIDYLEMHYSALRTLYKITSVTSGVALELVYIIADEAKRTNTCTVYLPIGKSDGWLSKQMRDHITETLIELYGKGKVSSSKDLKIGSVRKISTIGATSEDIKAALEEAQGKYYFTKFGYRVKIIVFKETGVPA